MYADCVIGQVAQRATPSNHLDTSPWLYVDQWDWEMAIMPENRTVFYLHEIVKKIYRCLKRAEFYIYDHYAAITPSLPENITLLYASSFLSSAILRASFLLIIPNCVPSVLTTLISLEDYQQFHLS